MKKIEYILDPITRTYRAKNIVEGKPKEILGRPVIYGKAMNGKLFIRLTDEHLEKLAKLAHKSKMTVSEYAREILLDKIYKRE